MPPKLSERGATLRSRLRMWTTWGERSAAGRRWFSPRSLRVQMVVGSAAIALGAVALVAIAAVLVSAVTFNEYRKGQLESQVTQMAEVLGHQQETFTPGTTSPLSTDTSAQTRFGPLNVWIMNVSGQVLASPTALAPGDELSNDDVSMMQSALKDAIAGNTDEGVLGGAVLPWQAQRFYVAKPVRVGGGTTGAIVGAVALSTLIRGDRTLAFFGSNNVTIFLSALAAALLAALVASYAARRLIRPLAHLTTASVRMAGGDYAARVHVHAPEELSRLAASFNEMAAALECDVAKLREQERMRRELVANVSHELATPLTAIQGFTEALIDGVVPDAEARLDTTHLIAREAARLRRLVDQLREVTTYEAGAQTLHMAKVALPSLLDETLAVLAPELERQHITLATDVPTELPPVEADADRLTEILLNLLDNALRFTPEGGRIEVAAREQVGRVAISIADTGPGIPVEDRQRIFERFYRADSSRSSATGGTGLGLAIVRELVEAHSGTITADARPDGGARFIFTLPTTVTQS